MEHPEKVDGFVHGSRVETIYNIQALRALAAYGVVIYHVIDALNNYIAHMDLSLKFPATGVDVFFVISGFIMAGTTEARAPTPGQFALQRIVRIVPIYWLLTIVAGSLRLAGLKMFAIEHIGAGNFAKSLFFIPDPARKPILFVGWTLNYEMMFYAIFALCLFIRNIRIRTAAIVGAIFLLWLVGRHFPDGSFLGYISDGIILEFAAGILVWQLAARIRGSIFAAGFGVVLAFCGLLFCSLRMPSQHLMVAPAAALLVLSVVILEERGVSCGKGLWKRQGDASYSLYLTHPFVIQFIGKIALVTHLNATLPGLVCTVIAMFFAAGLFGTWFHRAVERLMTDVLRNAMAVRGAAPLASASKDDN